MTCRPHALPAACERMSDEAKAGVFDYFERFYNPKRQHSTFRYLGSMEFEMEVQSALQGLRSNFTARSTVCRDTSFLFFP
jgi:hypothetical protein